MRKRLYNPISQILGEHHMPELIEMCLGFSYFNNESKFKEIVEEEPTKESMITIQDCLSDVSLALSRALYRRYVSKIAKNIDEKSGIQIAIHLSCEDYFRYQNKLKDANEKR